MRTIVTIPKPEIPTTPCFPRRPRSNTRIPRSSYRLWENGFVVNKTVTTAAENQRTKGHKKYRLVNEINKELEGENAIDLNFVARVGDGAYEKELESMTNGMSRRKLLGFMVSLEGRWCGRSEQRKLVNADEIVKVLPIGWKIEIAVRRRGEFWSLYCRSYVSPTGEQFNSCKDAAVYLRGQSSVDVAAPFQQGEMTQINDGSSHIFLKSINGVTSSSNLLENTNNNNNNNNNNKLLPAINGLYDVDITLCIECIPCGLPFDDMDALEKHLAFFHKETTRIFRLPIKSHTLDKAQTEPVQLAVVSHDEPRLGEASMSSQKIVNVEEPVAIVNGNNNCRFSTECTWCNKEFLCEPVDAETMADATGFMCPECKQKLCGALESSLSRAF